MRAWLALYVVAGGMFLATTFVALRPLPSPHAQAAFMHTAVPAATTAVTLPQPPRAPVPGVVAPSAWPQLCELHPDERPPLAERAECRPSHRADALAERIPLTVATAASDAFFANLRNAVGSVQLWEPDLEIAVYDLGLSKARAEEVASWCGVHYIPFDVAEKLPPYAKTLSNFAWKAAVVTDAAERFGKVFYIDSGIELRRPIDVIKHRIDFDGYFCVGMSDTLTNGGRPSQAEFFNLTIETFLGKPQIAGGIMGITAWGHAFRGIAKPALECSKNFDCIITSGPRQGESKPFGKDQTIFSELLYLHSAAQCAIDPAFTKYNSDFELPHPETTAGRQVLYVRRSQAPKPFDKHLIKSYDSPKCRHVQGNLRNTELWERLKTELPEETHPQEPCTCMRTLRPYEDYPTRLTIVTAADSSWFAELENLVGSVHYWEPRMVVSIYDLGLNADQLLKISHWHNVEVHPFFESCLEIESESFIRGNSNLCNTHVRRGTWRPFVFLHAAHTKGEFLFLSAGHELRNVLEPLALQLYRDSVFSVTVAHDLTQFADDRMLEAIGADHSFFEFKPICSPGVFGFACSRDILNRVLYPVAACARNYEGCWAVARRSEPVPKSSQVLSADDLVVSAALLNNTCYTCNRDLPYYAYRGASEPQRTTKATVMEHLLRNVDVLFNRQRRFPKPFATHLVKS